MSNHLHVVLRDDQSELSAWASYALGNLARAVNRLRRRRGTFFERRYSAEPILDVEALHDRLVYVVTNPVKAALCERASDWPGVVLFAPGGEQHQVAVSWVDRDAWRRARAGICREDASVLGADTYRVEGTLVIDPIPASDGAGPAMVVASIGARERALAEERSKARRRTLPLSRVLAQKWHSAPRRPKRSPRPLCHAGDPALRVEFRESFQTFMGVFREASTLLREGAHLVTFPDWSFPPGRQMVRPVVADTDPLRA